jgi:hypothetical protein
MIVVVPVGIIVPDYEYMARSAQSDMVRQTTRAAPRAVDKIPVVSGGDMEIDRHVRIIIVAVLIMRLISGPWRRRLPVDGTFHDTAGQTWHKRDRCRAAHQTYNFPSFHDRTSNIVSSANSMGANAARQPAKTIVRLDKCDAESLTIGMLRSHIQFMA